ncbi:MAG: NifU family protein [Phycisphaerales bacterium]
MSQGRTVPLPQTGPLSGKPIVVGQTTAGPAADEAVTSRVRKVLELIRPAVQSDGGDIEFVAMGADGVVQIRFHGACVGCPSSQMTLQVGVERNLKDYIPEVRGVQAID